MNNYKSLEDLTETNIMKKLPFYFCLKTSLIICFMFLNSKLFSQTTYQFMSSGTPDSGGAGFKTTTTSPSEANLIISNNIEQGFAANVLYPDKAITTPTDPVTFVIKGDGVNTDIFDFIDMNIFTYSPTPKTVEFETGTQIIFKNSSGGNIAIWSSLAISSLTANTNYSIKDIFGQTDGVDNVAEILLTVDYKLNDDITDFEVRTLILSDLETLSLNNFQTANKLKLYPNPSQGLIYFSKSVNKVVLQNISGQIIKRFGDVESIDASFLNSGVYMLSIELSDSRRIVKQVIKI